ncbi:FixH family protein [Oceanobacillus profundus]|uniref:FixH family protein n=1 Tax=Oceanobacillus profundus TaxID=372463 RepID=UPI0026E1615A|nr:FixH family protein [Oceanobacillus profundus]MDO6449431.1 FixH family protein [Oceanobacillus profundus]
MRKLFLLMLASVLVILTACGGNEDEGTADIDELMSLEVEFEVPETAKVGETILLKAIVTYGDENVDDADEVSFEYWKEGNEDDSTTIKSTNNGDGTYTAEIIFEHEGVFSLYAHTTARDLHTMPKKSVTVEKDDVE